MSALKVDRILTTTNAMAAVRLDFGATFVANLMVASLRSRSCEIPGAAAARPERQDNAEIKVEDEEEEKRRYPSFPLCETSAFWAGGGGEFASEPALPRRSHIRLGFRIEIAHRRIPPDHHLFPGLVAPSHVLRRVGVDSNRLKAGLRTWGYKHFTTALRLGIAA
jgi:hypothetical protein